MPTINTITDTTKFKTWIETINYIIAALRPATHTTSGLLTSEDKIKLDSIESGADRVDIDNVTVSVNNSNSTILLEGNTGKSHILNFVPGNGVNITSSETQSGTSKKYNVSISSSSYSQATGSTETESGSLGLVQAPAGVSERMLFADMSWRTAESSVVSDSDYPISSRAVNDALNEYARKNHASSESTYGLGTEYTFGHVKLIDNSSDALDVSSGVAVTPKALYNVEQTAQRAEQQANQNHAEISELQNKIVGAYRYAGTVSSYDDLLDISASVGDVYNVSTTLGNDGPNYAWNGMSWDNLGGLLSIDTQPVQGSNNAITSGSVYNEISKLAPKNHASSETIYGLGNSENYGHLKLTDNIDDSYKMNDGYAVSPSVTYQLWQYEQQTRDMVIESGNYHIFNSADEAYLPDAYHDENAVLSVPSKIAFAEVNTLVSEITQRVENIELNYANTKGDEFTGNVKFSAGTRENIVSLNASESIIYINPDLSNNFSLDCVKNEYEIDIQDIDDYSATFTLVIRGGENITFIWPDTVRWSNNMEPYLSSNIDILKFYTIDGGENWYVTHELSNSTTFLNIYGIITENDGYLYRLTDKMISKWKMPLSNETVMSSVSDGQGNYYILTKIESDSTTKHIYKYNGLDFQMYKSVYHTSDVMHKLYYHDSLYGIESQKIYKISDDSVDLSYTTEYKSSNILDFIIYNDIPYVIVYRSDVKSISVLYGTSDSQEISNEISKSIVNVQSENNIHFCILNNSLFVLYDSGMLIIDTNNNVTTYAFSCNDIISFVNDTMLSYFNNGIGTISVSDTGIDIHDWKYIGENYNVSDIKTTHLGLVISGNYGAKYPEFVNDSDGTRKEKLFNFSIVRIPYSQEVTEKRTLENSLDMSKIRYYTTDENKVCYDVNMKIPYDFVKIIPEHTVISSCDIIIVDNCKFGYIKLDFDENSNVYPTVTVPLTNSALSMGTSMRNIEDSVMKTTDVKYVIDCHTPSVDQNFVMCCDNGYIIDNLSGTYIHGDTKTTKIENTQNDSFVSGFCFMQQTDNSIEKIVYAITKTGYLTSYNFELKTWTDAIETKLSDDEKIDECYIMTTQDNNIILYGIKNNQLIKCTYIDESNIWKQEYTLYDFSKHSDNIQYLSHAIMDNNIIMVIQDVNTNTCIAINIDTMTNTCEQIILPVKLYGLISGMEVVDSYCYMTTTDGKILSYDMSYGCRIVFDTYRLYEFSGFMKTYDNNMNTLYAVTTNGVSFMLNIDTEIWEMKENFYIGSGKYFSAQSIN